MQTWRTYQKWLLPAALLLLFLAVRLPGLGRFVTTDEAHWFRRSANFYFAVAYGDWASTRQSPHPGAVTMWAGAAAYQWRFPEYLQLGEADVHDTTLLQTLENNGLNPADILSSARLVLVLLHAAAFVALWPFARRWLGDAAAGLGMALLALEPFLIAHQRLLHLDGLLASLMLLAVLAYWDHLQTRRPVSLLVSALAAGLALLTKTPAWFLFPFAALLTAWQLYADGAQRNLRARFVSLVQWGAGSLLLMYALLPAMWQAPVQEVADMLGYSLGTAQGEYSGPLFFNGRVYPDGDFGLAAWYFYPAVYLWRSTPLSVLGLGLALYFLCKDRQILAAQRTALLCLLGFAVAFMAFMGLADKQFDRYVLPSLPALCLVAGWGWWAALARLRPAAWQAAAAAAVLGLQLFSATSVFPYYLTYYNSALRAMTPVERHMMIGWGEGLDQAAIYLKPRQGSVAAWYANSFNLLYPPSADAIPITLELTPARLADLLAHDYLVIYVHQWQRGTPQNLLDALAPLQPEYTVVLNGIEYVRVYRLSDGQ